MQNDCITPLPHVCLTCLKRITSSLLFCCWLWALTLAASPALHKWAHGDEAGHDDHDCAAMLLVTGSCDAPGVVPVAVIAPVEFAVISWPLAGRDAPAAIFLSGMLEHGPPAPHA